MNLKVLFSALFVTLFLAISCEKQTLQTDSKISEETLALVDDEVLSDINFAELLDESDDGIFWGDAGFFSLKSAETERTCPAREVDRIDNKVKITLTFSGEDCGKSGTIIIEYLKPNDKTRDTKKLITYVDFTNKNGITFNGTKTIIRGKDNYNIKADLIITKQNDEGEEVKFVRNYHRQIKWICGLDTRKNRNDNIKKVTGQSEVVKFIDGVEVKSYSRKILKPLLIVKACALKIQAGVVKIEKSDGTELKIDYGKIAEDIDCDSEFECNSEIEITKDGETFTVTFDENGKRVKQNKEV
jgi:hypothetical protein